MKIVRYIYVTIIVLLMIGAGISLWYYQKQSAWYEEEKAGLEQIGKDHEAKVKEMEQNKK